MFYMSFIFRWSCLLGFALLGPATLPAGGAEIYQPLIRRREVNEPFLSVHGLSLFMFPSSKAPAIEVLRCGTPLRLIHYWPKDDGSHWLYVRAEPGDVGITSSSANRGWVNV